MVSGWSATTELSSLMASSTTRRFAAFFRSRIAVLKSLLVPLLQQKTKNRNQKSKIPKFEKLGQNREEGELDLGAYGSDDSALSVMIEERAGGGRPMKTKQRD